LFGYFFSGEQPDVPANKLELVSNDREVMAACQHDTKERAVEEELDEFLLLCSTK
jgi:hypothetical protein